MLRNARYPQAMIITMRKMKKHNEDFENAMGVFHNDVTFARNDERIIVHSHLRQTHR